jgi:hypothetical protein
VLSVEFAAAVDSALDGCAVANSPLYILYSTLKLLLSTSQVRTIASINLNQVALVDEQRNANLNTSLQSSWLQSVGSGVALDTRL